MMASSNRDAMLVHDLSHVVCMDTVNHKANDTRLVLRCRAEQPHVAIFGQQTIDRSPCGTGTCARMAVLHARGELGVGQRFVSKSIIGTRFVGEIVGETRVGEFPAIIPEVSGRAYVTGLHQFVLDPDDPFPNGFSLSDRSVEGGC